MEEITNNSNRLVAILFCDDGYTDNVRKNVDLLMEKSFSAEITVFTTSVKDEFNFERNGTKCSNIIIPETADTEPKRRNWINAYYRDSVGWKGFLWVMNDGLELLKDPSEFASDLEKTMDVLDYSVFMSTRTDRCNYVMSKYNPCMSISLDRPDVTEKIGLSGKVHFTSNSNSQCFVYDMRRDLGDLLRFDEDFTIAMFWIIEFQSRRRNTKPNGSLYFMNWYLSIDSENGVWRNAIIKSEKKPEDFNSEAMQREDTIFKSKRINNISENNVDEILETFWEKLKSKTGISE